MEHIFSRLEALIGASALERLKGAHVCVFGLGGVGGHAAEALVRSGVGTLTVVDNDTVAKSNINRQIIALESTVGKNKTDVFKARAKDINPDVKIINKCLFFDNESLAEFNFGDYDYIVDAIDSVSSKVLLIKSAKDRGTPIISCMGTGNKLSPAMLSVADVYKTSVCPLARVMRRELRQIGIKDLKVVYSTEEPKRVDEKGRTPSSSAFVPAAAGMILASEVIKDLIKE